MFARAALPMFYHATEKIRHHSYFFWLSQLINAFLQFNANFSNVILNAVIQYPVPIVTETAHAASKMLPKYQRLNKKIRKSAAIEPLLS